MFLPAKTPPAVIARLERELTTSLATPEMKERFTKLGLYAVGSSSADFRKFVANSIKQLAEIARIAGIKPE